MNARKKSGSGLPLGNNYSSAAQAKRPSKDLTQSLKHPVNQESVSSIRDPSRPRDSSRAGNAKNNETA